MPSPPRNRLTSGIAGQTGPLVSSATHQYAVLYTGIAESTTDPPGVKVARRARVPGGAWTTHQIDGDAAVELDIAKLPDDAHCYPAIGRDGQGRLHVLANMHTDRGGQAALRYITSTAGDPGNGDGTDITQWTPDTLSIGGLQRFTYPVFAHCADGTLILYLRAGPDDTGSGHAHSYIWRRGPGPGDGWVGPSQIFDGGDVPGPDDEYDYSAYPTNFYVESSRDPHPGRIHLGWVWRQWGVDGRTNTNPSYMYSDDNGETWSDIAGAPVTLPVSYDTPTGVQTGLAHPTNLPGYTGYLNWGGICIDNLGLPHMAVSVNPWLHIWWDGSSWQQASIADENKTLNGYQLVNRLHCVWLRGALWILAATTTSPPRHLRLFKADGSVSVPISHSIDSVIEQDGAWEGNVDWEAFRRFGSIETLCPDDEAPLTYDFGNGYRAYAQ